MQERQWTITDRLTHETITCPSRPSAMATLMLIMREHGDSAEFSVRDGSKSIEVRRSKHLGKGD